jgi:hypothetical protein
MQSLQNETFQAIKVDLRDICEMVNEIWRTLDFALAPDLDRETQRGRIVVAKVTCSAWGKIQFDSLDALARDISPLTRRSVQVALEQLKFIEPHVNEFSKRGDPEVTAADKTIAVGCAASGGSGRRTGAAARIAAVIIVGCAESAACGG